MKKRNSIPRIAHAPFGLFALLILLSASRLFAGGGFVSIHVDVPLLTQNASHGNWMLNYDLRDHSNYFQRHVNNYAANVISLEPNLHLEKNLIQEDNVGNPNPICSIHHTNALHACENPLYSTNWNPSILNAENRGPILAQDIAAPNNHPLVPQQMLQTIADWDNLRNVESLGSDPKYDIEINVQIPAVPEQQITPRVQEILYDTFIDFYGNEIQFSMVGPALYFEGDQEFEQPQETIYLDEADAIEQPAQIASEATTEAQAANEEERGKQSSNTVAPSVSLQTWPNPSTGKFQARLSGQEGTKVELQVMSMDGKILASATSMGESTQFDLSNYAAGTYFVKATTAQGSAWSKPIVIQH